LDMHSSQDMAANPVRTGARGAPEGIRFLRRIFILPALISALLILAPSVSAAQTAVYSWSASNYFTNHNSGVWSLAWVSGTSGPLRCTCTNTNSLWFTLVPESLTALQSGSTYFADITFAVHTPTVEPNYFYIYARNTAGRSTGNQYDIWQQWIGDSSTTTRTISVPLDLSTMLTGTGTWSVNLGVVGPASLDIYSYTIYQGTKYVTTPPVLNGTAAANADGVTAATGYTPFTITPPATGGTAAPVVTGTSLIPNSPTAGVANAAALNQALALCASSSSHLLTITTGTYWFSGTNQIGVTGLTDLTIDGQGSVFVFAQVTSSGVGVGIQNCARMVIQNLTFDWDWTVEPIASLGQVENLVSTGSTSQCDFVFNDLNATQVSLVKSTPWQSMFAMDPTTLVAASNNGIFTVPGGTAISSGSAGNVLHASFRAVAPLVDGSSYCIRHMYYNMAVFKVFSTNNIVFNNVNIYSFPGMGWLWEGDSHDWELLGCNIQRAPGSTHPLTTAADGIHSMQSLGDIAIENCTFTGLGDDTINIHDCCYEAVVTTSATNANMVNLADYTINPLRPNTGDVLEFYNPDYSYLNGSSSPVLSGSVTSISPNGSNEAITFATAVPSPLSPNAILRNTRYNTSNIHIANCSFLYTNGDGILLSASGATVENCAFDHVCGTGIELETNIEQNLWSEGDGAANVLVQNNSFAAVDDIGISKFGAAVIFASPILLPWGPTTANLYNTLTIANNTFENCSGPAVALRNCANVTVDSNQVIYTQPMPYSTRYAGAILTQYSSNLALGGNTWTDLIPSTYAYGVVSDTSNTTNVFTGTNALAAYKVSGVVAVSGTGQVALNWNAPSSGVLNYKVKRATVSGGPYSTIASPTGASYSDSTGVAGTVYYYVVTAITARGETVSSAEVCGVNNPTPIQQWRQAYFGTMDPNSVVASDTASPAGDGVPNLMKYALWLNPTIPANGALVSTGEVGVYLTLTFNRVGSATDITYSVEGSSDLIAWSALWSSASVPYAGGTNAFAPVTVSDTVSISTAPMRRRFLRLRITQP
jgi:hypothetical protein